MTQVPIVPEETGTLGRMTVEVPPGEGYLLLVYEDTQIRRVGGIISITTMLILAAGALAAVLYRRTKYSRR